MRYWRKADERLSGKASNGISAVYLSTDEPRCTMQAGNDNTIFPELYYIIIYPSMIIVLINGLHLALQVLFLFVIAVIKLVPIIFTLALLVVLVN